LRRDAARHHSPFMPLPSNEPLTHAAIAGRLRDHFGTLGFERGAAMQRNGAARIGSARMLDPGEYRLCGTVQGSQPEPYATAVCAFVDLANGEFEILSCACDCPVGVSCKHACALTLAWLAHWPCAERGARDPRAPAAFAGVAEIAADDHRETGNRTTHDCARPPAAPKVRRMSVGRELDVWLSGAMDTALAAAKASQGKAQIHQPAIFYVLTERARLHALRGRQRRDTAEAELTGERTKTHWVHADREPPAYAAPSDPAILKLVVAAADPAEYLEKSIACIRGTEGYQLLSLAAATGRLYAMREADVARALDKRADVSQRRLGRPLAFTDLRVASLKWDIVDGNDGHFPVIAGSMGGDAVALIPSEPPCALHLARHELSPVSLAVSSATLLKLRSLPRIDTSDAVKWAYVRDALDTLPDAQGIPPLPVSHDRRLLKPRAILSFALIEYRHQVGWGRNSFTETTTFPGVQLWFDYAGRRLTVSRHGFSSAVEVEETGGEANVILLRNIRAEAEWQRRVPRTLVSAVQVEAGLAQGRLDGELELPACYALPRHDWAHQGAQVFADAQAAGFEIEVDPAFPLVLEDIPKPELELTPAPERGWFRFALGVQVNDQKVDLAPALAKLIGAQADADAWLAALPRVPMVLLSLPARRGQVQSTVVRIPGERVHALLAPVFDWLRGGNVEPISGLQAALQPELPASVVRYLGRDEKRWIALREAVASSKPLEPANPHHDFRATLRPYQLHGLAWLEHLRQLSMAGVLADDMGLGKTVQTLAFLHRRRKADRAPQPSLIVAPTSVSANWMAEIARFAPDLSVVLHRGTTRSLTDAALGQADLVVTSYPILQRDEKRIAELKFDVVVFDEAQTIKNPRAKTYQAAQGVDAAMRIALTGTPMENHLGELWALFNLLSPGLLGDLDNFNRVFRHPIEQHNADEQMQKLRARVRPFLLRRTRAEVLDDLPERTEYTRWIELNPGQADLYESLRTAIHDDIRKVIDEKGIGRSAIHILDALLKLRQVCCDPRLVKLPEAKKQFAHAGSAKLDWLMTHVPELLDEGHRVLIFSQFTSMLKIIGEGLSAQGIDFEKLTGDTVERATPIARFQSGEVNVFLLSLKAGGVGLNLTAADTVIHFDPWWNPAVEEQATARAHRIGQKNPVFVTRLVSKGTLEERMLTLLARKRELAAALLEGEGSALTGLTMADVEELLAPIHSLVSRTK
jgi:superfamily II DNA or RNA helicase